MNASFAPILEVGYLMAGFTSPWFVSGGWAIDLFLDVVTRKHSDIEIGVYRVDQFALRHHFRGHVFQKVIQTEDGGEWVGWGMDDELHLPAHQIKATDPKKTAGREFEFFLNERTDTHWVSRRHPGLTRPVGEVALMSSLDIPFLAPEMQLLFKAKHTRAKDQADFERTLPRLSPYQRGWLLSALHAHHPNHPWLLELD